jgi:hypothetical protein
MKNESAFRLTVIAMLGVMLAVQIAILAVDVKNSAKLDPLSAPMTVKFAPFESLDVDVVNTPDVDVENTPDVHILGQNQ